MRRNMPEEFQSQSSKKQVELDGGHLSRYSLDVGAAGLYYELKYGSRDGVRHRSSTLSSSAVDTDEWEWEFELDQWDLSFEKVESDITLVELKRLERGCCWR